MANRNIVRGASIALICLVASCSSDDVATRSYPSVDTRAASGINENGAYLNAEILSTGSAGISDHGFVYDDIQEPSLEKSDRISLGERSGKGSFSALAERNLRSDKKYFVKAYAISKTGSITVYGQQVEFVSLGGGKPAIDDFTPKQGVAGDTVVVTGHGFSSVLSNNVIRFGPDQANVIRVEGNQLWCIVPTFTAAGENDVSITLGDHRVNAASKFTLLEILLNSADVEWVTYRDVVTLNVTNAPRQLSFITVTILGQQAEVISYDGTALRAKVSDYVLMQTAPVTVKVGSQTKTSPYTLNLKQATITLFTPVEGKKDAVVTISGSNFHPNKEKNTVKFGPYTVDILNASANILTVKLPSQVIDQRVIIEVNSADQIVNTEDVFHILSPWRKVSSMPIDEQNMISSWSACNFGYVVSGDAWKYNPANDSWLEIAPAPFGKLFASVTFNTLCNGYVGTGSYSWGGSNENFYSYTDATDTWNEISKMSQPGAGRYNAVGWNLKGQGYVTLGTRGNLGVPIRETMKYDPASNSWSQVKPYPGEFPPDYWTIYSTGFALNDRGYALIVNLSENKNYFWRYDPTSNDWNQLASFPGIAKSAMSFFGINDAAYVVGGSKNPSGYEGNAVLSDVWKYNMTTNTWSQIESFPGGARQSAVSFTIGDRAYYGGGIGVGAGGSHFGSHLNDFWEFDPSKL